MKNIVLCLFIVCLSGQTNGKPVFDFEKYVAEHYWVKFDTTSHIRVVCGYGIEVDSVLVEYLNKKYPLVDNYPYVINLNAVSQFGEARRVIENNYLFGNPTFKRFGDNILTHAYYFFHLDTEKHFIESTNNLKGVSNYYIDREEWASPLSMTKSQFFYELARTLEGDH